jgi:hypothetical protein
VPYATCFKDSIESVLRKKTAWVAKWNTCHSDTNWSSVTICTRPEQWQKIGKIQWIALRMEGNTFYGQFIDHIFIKGTKNPTLGLTYNFTSKCWKGKVDVLRGRFFIEESITRELLLQIEALINKSHEILKISPSD